MKSDSVGNRNMVCGTYNQDQNKFMYVSMMQPNQLYNQTRNR